MVADYRQHLSQYAALGFDAQAVFAFIQRAEKEQLPAGRYELDDERLFAMIQEYETKERECCFYEAHKLYGDIQYMALGTEVIYGAHVDGLKVVENRMPGEDIVFYDRAFEEETITLKAGMFAVFLPQDAHMPCCQYKKQERVRKIVIKFRVPSECGRL